MNRILLSICALMLSASAANAQFLNPSLQVSKLNMVTPKTTATQFGKFVAPAQEQSQKKLAPQKLTANQKAVGVSGSDTMSGAIGLPTAPAVKGAYNWMEKSDLAKFAGCKIVGARYLIYGSLGSSAKVQLYSATVTQEGVTDYTLLREAPASSQEISSYNQSTESFDQKWNEVTFDKPINVDELPSDKALFLGYTYKQKATKSNGDWAKECFPIAAGSGTTYILAHGPFGDNGADAWAAVSDKQVMCIQFILEKDGGFPDDLSIAQVVINPMVKPNETLPIDFYVNNFGSKECKAATFDVLLDDKSLAEISMPADAAIGSKYTKLSAEVELPENIEIGAHLVSVKVKTVNGEAPVGDTSDDQAAAQFRTYTNATPRQYNLVEQFTSTNCVGCPYGYATLRALQKSRDDIAWVAIHGRINKNDTDPYVNADAEGSIVYYSVKTCPSANFNRFNLGGTTIAGNISVEEQYTDELVKELNNILDMEDELAPSQVRLNMETNLTVGDNPNLDNATLNITIKGTGVKNAAKVLKGAVLGLYITENGESSKQYSPNGWLTGFAHENILRVIGTENPWGDEIVWNGDNFEKTYEVTIPKKQYNYINNKNTLNAVAYVSLPYVIKGEDGKNYLNGDLENVWVNQCQFLQLPKGQATAIKGVETSENATVVARYAADGSQISAPVKGINILKMSDGTTRKVVVK